MRLTVKLINLKGESIIGYMKLSLPAKIILAAVVYVILSQVLHTASTFLTMGYYTDPNYFPVWSKVMMPGPGPPPATFYYYSIAFSFISGLIYSFVYSRIGCHLKGKALQKGIRYGLGLFLVAGIPTFFTMYLLVNLPFGLLVSWLTIDTLLGYLIAGIAIAKIVR